MFLDGRTCRVLRLSRTCVRAPATKRYLRIFFLTSFIARIFDSHGGFLKLLASLGVQTDYVEYMMGHAISTYHDIQMKGIEFLRRIYIASGLNLRPKTRVSKIDALKEIIRAWGLNPEEVLTREALSQPHRTVFDQSQLEQAQLTQLTMALKQQMLKEIRETQTEKSMNSRLGCGSPGVTVPRL